MADTPNSIPAPPPGFSPVPDQSAGTIPPPPPGFSPVDQPMVTNSVGETMPADVAARHALTREGQTQPTPITDGRAKVGEFVTNAVMGMGKEGLKTIQGTTALANKVLPYEAQIPTLAAAADTDTHGFGEGLGGMIEQALEFMSPDEVFAGLKRVHDVEKLAAGSKVVSGVLKDVPQIMKHIAKSAAKSAAIGGAQGAIKGAAEGDAVGGAEGGALGGGVGGALGEAGGQILKAGAEKVGIGTSATEDAMRGAKPAKRNYKFSDDFLKAAPRLAEHGEDAKTLEDWANAGQEARQKLWNTEIKPEIDARADKNLFDGVAANPVADAIRARITPAMQRLSPKSAKALETVAKRFDGPMTVAEAEQNIEHLNAELMNEGYWKKTPSERAALDKANPKISASSAAAEQIRESLYDFLKKDGAPKIDELKQTYGALRNFENEVRGQVNVVGRQSRISLKEMIGMTAGVAHGGPLGAAAAALPVVDKVVNSPERMVGRAVKKAAAEAAGEPAPVAERAVNAVANNLGKTLAFLGSDGRKYIAPNRAAWEKVQKADPGAQLVQ